MFHVEHSQEWFSTLTEGALALNLSLNDRHITSFSIFLRELSDWNRKINLTAVRDPKAIIVKHFLDSLAFSKALAPLCPDSTVLDVGSGAGFPGLPLKILDPSLTMTLLEPNQKKIAFIRRMIGILQLDGAQAVSRRLEDFAADSQLSMQFAYVTTRAVKQEFVMAHVAPVLAKQGRVILGRSKPLETPCPFLGYRITGQIGYALPFGYGKRVLSVLQQKDEA